MATEPPHILRARQLLDRISGADTQLRSDEKPVGVVTLSDILDAEKRLAAAQTELRDYNASTDGMRETIDQRGIKGLVVESYRYEQAEHLQGRVSARSLELEHLKRSWIGGN